MDWGEPAALAEDVERHRDWLRTMRETAPVAYDDESGNWHVFGHAEVMAMLNEPDVFSSEFAETERQRELGLSLKGNPVVVDGPRHRELRSLVNQALTPRSINGLAGRVARITNDLLDAAAGRDRIDLVDDLAHPLPVTVIAELLGVPPEDRAQFRSWSEALLALRPGLPAVAGDYAGEEVVESTLPWIRDMSEYLLAHARLRRVMPEDDLVSRLVEAEIDGRRLDDEEIVGFAGLLLFAGHITTTMLLGNAVLALHENPRARDEVRDDPELLPGALEEVLRLSPPDARLERRVTRDVTAGGHLLPAGAFVALWVSSVPDSRRFHVA